MCMDERPEPGPPPTDGAEEERLKNEFFALVAEAGQPLRRVHEREISSINPLRANPGRDAAELDAANRELDAICLRVGMKASEGLEEPGMDADERLRRRFFVGLMSVRGGHPDEVERHEREIALWRRGDWAALLDMGQVSPDEYRELSSRWPRGNPRSPGAEAQSPKRLRPRRR